MKRSIICGAIVLLTGVALAVFARYRIWSESRLGEVCKEKTQAYFTAKGNSPSEWAELPATMKHIGFDEPSIFHTYWNFYGRWRVGQQHFDVKCVSKFGQSIDDVQYEINESTSSGMFTPTW